MTVTVDVGARQTAARIASRIDPVFAMIDSWRDAVAAGLARQSEPTAAALEKTVAVLVVPELESPDSLISGAGFVAAPGYLADRPWHLAWWLSGANTFGAPAVQELRRLEVVSDPDSEQFRDYTALEWWRVPARTGSRHLTGPYVDYLCTDDYTVTITTPVLIDGVMVGLVGTDLYVASLERVLLPVIRESATPATLVNASSRILTSTDSRRATGALLRLDGLADALAPLREREGAPGRDAVGLPSGATVLPCGDTSLALVLEG